MDQERKNKNHHHTSNHWPHHHSSNQWPRPYPWALPGLARPYRHVTVSVTLPQPRGVHGHTAGSYRTRLAASAQFIAVYGGLSAPPRRQHH